MAGQAGPVAWLQYRMSADVTATSGLSAPVRAVMGFSIDDGSFPNGIFDKPSDSQFRALVACSVRIHYSVGLDANGNNVGAEVRVLKNGSALTFANSGSSPRGSANEPRSVSRTLRLDMAVNDFVEFDVGVLELVASVTAEAARSVASMEAVVLL